MTNKQRVDLVERHIREHHYADLRTLAERFQSSVSTVRRALDQLEQRGVVRRHHGGASLVETDAFCDCGYNLHGQPVWRDEELQILLCRCPECGRHAAAGRFTGIHAAWLHRLSFALIVSWVGFLLGLFIFLTFMLGVWPGGYTSDAISWNSVPNTGPNQTQYVYDLTPTSYRNPGRQLWFNVTIYGFATLTGLITGAIERA